MRNQVVTMSLRLMGTGSEQGHVCVSGPLTGTAVKGSRRRVQWASGRVPLG